MTRRFLGVRWWLGAAFAVVAALSTAIVVSQYSSRSESQLRANGEDKAVATAFDAAAQLAAGAVKEARVVALARREGVQLAGTIPLIDVSRRRGVAEHPERETFIAHRVPTLQTLTDD